MEFRLKNNDLIKEIVDGGLYNSLFGKHLVSSLGMIFKARLLYKFTFSDTKVRSENVI